MENKIGSYIQFIVEEASAAGIQLTTVCLVKYLYLLDLYAARDQNGVTATGWKWIFHSFGPFTIESLDAIKAAAERHLIGVNKLPSNFSEEDYSLFSATGNSGKNGFEIIPLAVRVNLRSAIKEYLNDTNRLLHHVYFETEPMLSASPGEALNFSEAHWFEKKMEVAMKPLTKGQIERGRNLVRSLASGAAPLRRRVPCDAILEESIRLMDDADRNGIGGDGEADVSTLLKKTFK